MECLLAQQEQPVACRREGCWHQPVARELGPGSALELVQGLAQAEERQWACSFLEGQGHG